MISLTESAVKQLEHIQKSEGKQNLFLRVSVTGGGCSGLSYKLDFVETQNEKDKLFDCGAVKVIVDTKSYLYINGMELDFSGGLNGKGFVFNNPNAKKSCGCGSSFST